MTIASEVLPASYAGVSFLFIRHRIEGGRKDALSPFPNSDLQDVEDLGLKVRTYNVEAIITEDSSGEGYRSRRDNFLRVLEAGDKEVLIHPLYGRLNDIRVRSFVLTEDFSALGEARFSIVFAIDNTDGVPIVSEETLPSVNNAVVVAIAQVNQYLIDNFNVSTSFPSNFTDAVDKVNGIVSAFEENTTFLQVTSEGVDNFTEQLVELQSNVTSLITQPAELINSIDRLFTTVNGLYNNIESTLEVMGRFFSFGDSDAEIIENTASRIEKSRNQNLLNNLVKAQSLLFNYSNAAQITFTTVSQVNEVAQSLENQYQDVVTGADFDRVTKDSITETRVQVQKFFDDQQLSVRQVIDVQTVTLPARVLAYQYYGDSSEGLNIASLNEDMNVSFLTGTIGVFTE